MGLTISYNYDVFISFSQEHLVNELLEETKMDVANPIESSTNKAALTNIIELEYLDAEDHTKYRSMIKSLMYIVN